jgi:threonyl-tRNA synthetase
MEKVPYVLVVGDDDVAAGTVGVNARGEQQAQRGVPLDQFEASLLEEISTHALSGRGAWADASGAAGAAG